MTQTGHPIPGGLADNPQTALRLAEKVGWPVVLKRPIGGNGDSVVLSIRDSTSCLEAAAKLLDGGHPYLVVERMLAGVELRAHFVNGRLFELRSTEKKLIAPDGFSSLGHLIEGQHPEFWRAVTRAEWMRQRLTFGSYVWKSRKAQPALLAGNYRAVAIVIKKLRNRDKS